MPRLLVRPHRDGGDRVEAQAPTRAKAPTRARRVGASCFLTLAAHNADQPRPDGIGPGLDASRSGGV